MLAFVALVAGSPLTATAGQTSPVTIAWDAPADPAVAGYIVYVGIQSGTYREQFDVGNNSVFDYLSGEVGRRYFFAVKSYNGGAVLSERSNEVSVVIGESVSGGGQGQGDGGQISPSPRRQRWPDPSSTGSDVPAGPSSAIRRGTVRALADAGDEGVLFVEGGRVVRALANGMTGGEPFLVANDAVELSGLAVDPAFSETRLVFVGEVETLTHGVRELTIARYRVVGHAFGQRAVILSGFALPTVGNPVFDLDASGHLYIAMPAAPDGGSSRDSYAGMILRFNVDGTVPHQSRAASPIIAYGYDQPTDLKFDGMGRLWLAGKGASWSQPLAVLGLNSISQHWPAIPQGIEVMSSAAANGVSALEIVPPRTPGELSKLMLLSGDRLAAMPLNGDGLGVPTFWSLGGHGIPTALLPKADTVYVSFASDGGDLRVNAGASIARFNVP